MKRGDESGQLMVLTMGLALVVFAVAGLAIDGTSAFLIRRSLQNAADSAAVVGASQIDTSLYYGSGGSQVRLNSGRAEVAAIRSLEERGLRTTTELVAEGNMVTIVLRTGSPTTFLKLVGIDEIPVAVSATARPFSQVVTDVP